MKLSVLTIADQILTFWRYGIVPIKVAHPNLYISGSYSTGNSRLHDGRRTCKQWAHHTLNKSNLLYEVRIKACINKFDSGAYDRLQFLKTVSHALDAHTPSVHDSSSSTDDEEDEVGFPNRLFPLKLQSFQSLQRPHHRHLRWQTAVKSVFWCHDVASS